MQLTEQQAKLLLAFYSSDGMTLKYAEYARENGMKKYEVSRIGESLSEMGLINRDDPRRLILTDEGESAAKDIKTRIEIAKSHLSYENVNSADIDGIAFTWALHCPYSLFDAIEKIDQHYKTKSYFNKSEAFNGSQLARKIDEGFFVLPCMLHKLEDDPMTPHTNVSMANDAFKRSCEVRVHKGKGYVILFPMMMTMNRTTSNPMVHTARPITGKPFNFMYWNGNKYVPVQIENDTLKIPIDDFQFVCLGEDIASRVLMGSIEISATCSSGGMTDENGNARNMRAMLTVYLH